MIRLSRCFSILLVLTLWAPRVWSQATRAEEFDALRQKKAADAKPDKRNNIESALLWLQERKLVEKLETPGAGWHGIRPRLGGLSNGSGFGFGAQYDRVRMLDGQLDFSLVGAASPIGYQHYETKLDLPRLADEHAFLQVKARRRVMPREDFFGTGPDSTREGRTAYFQEDNSAGVRGGVRPVRWLRFGAGAEWLGIDIRSGTDPRFPSTELLYNDQNTPGLNDQPDFLKSEGFVAIDWRDSLGNPRSGGYYAATLSSYKDRTLDQFDFRRFEVELQQYVPFNAGHRVIAFRFGASFDDSEQGKRVPFYLQKTLGGANDLRGFREFRFRDQNRMVFNLEYRWEAFSGLDMALFGDAGKVFADRGDFDLKKLEKAYGFGLRFNTVKNVFLRLDFARGREGLRTFITFENVF
jgi:hypothetical protein